ncbi:MAG: DNA gyrase inhibitor YacG [Rhodoferax sp.]
MTQALSPEPLSPRWVNCPSCGGPSLYARDNPFRPFCSQRCQHIDLGAWASEQFAVPAQALPEDPLASHN